MKRKLLSYLPLTSYFYYKDSGWKIDRANGLDRERINQKYNFHFNYMMLGIALGIFYYSAGVKFKEWNPLMQATIIENNVENMLERVLEK